MRSTLNKAVKFRGIGLHCGQPVTMTVAPAAADTGIVFHRTDAGAGASPIPASYENVGEARLCTKLVNSDGLSVSTVEHLMAALSGCGVTDARVALDGPEVPIMDGSAVAFVREFAEVGVRCLGVPQRAIKLLEPVTVSVDGKLVELSPAPQFEMDFCVSFADPAIGRQSKYLVLTGGAVVSELSDSRTFGRLADVETLRLMGLGLGGALDNAVIVDNGRVLNAGGLRHPDEFVRHKMLDAVGDLALAGAPIIGRYTGLRAGHAVSNLLLRKLFASTDSWVWSDLAPDLALGGPLDVPIEHVSDASIAV
jgi:UDP-3-O-[3-hydroxymyristoyl] N-acetylglucosamine deacetylase